MQALKGLVAGLGILIVIAMSMIGYGLYRKSNDPGFKFFSWGAKTAAPASREATASSGPAIPLPARAMPAAPLPAFGETMIGLPAGCTIDGVSGGDGRIYLRIGPNTADCRRVVVLNAASGAQIGVIRIAR